MPRDIEAASVAHTARRRQNGPAFARATQVRQSQGVPRAVFIGLLRMAPGGRTLSGATPFGTGAYPPLWTQLGVQWRAAGAPGHMRLGPPGRFAASPSESVIPRPPLPAPCLKMLYRHPSVTRRDVSVYSPRLWLDYGPRIKRKSAPLRGIQGSRAKRGISFHFRFRDTADMAGHAAGRVSVENDPKRTFVAPTDPAVSTTSSCSIYLRVFCMRNGQRPIARRPIHVTSLFRT